jgi:glycosyltransferase involved in cell wall biosynthesis
MKIVINALGPAKVKAGIGNYIFNLISELSKIDDKNKYIIFAAIENKDFYRTANKNFFVININFWGRNRFIRILWEQLILPFKLIEFKADILFSSGFICPIIKTAINVLTIHDMTFFSHPDVHTFFKKIYFPFMIKRSANRSEKIIAVSHNTKKEIIKYAGINENKIVVTHLSANNFPQNDIENEKKFLEEKYGINTEYLLFVGMIEPRKNINLIIEALGKITDKSVKLVIVGKKGWMVDDLFEEIKVKKLENRVIFTGFVPDEELELFYKNAKVFLYPSLYEGFGIPVLEAMKAGCPVITSNISSLPEVAGDAAIQIKPQNSEELVNAIDSITKDKNMRNELIEKGLENAEKFSWGTTAKQTLEIFHQLGKQNTGDTDITDYYR